MAEQPKQLKGKGFQKGKSGNPSGRPPKARCIPDILEKLSNEGIANDPLIPAKLKKQFLDDGRRDATKLETLLRLVYLYALQGKPWAVQFLADRTEGKPRQPIDVNDDRVTDITVEIVRPKKK